MTSPSREVKVVLRAETADFENRTRAAAKAVEEVAKSSERARDAMGRFVSAGSQVGPQFTEPVKQSVKSLQQAISELDKLRSQASKATQILAGPGKQIDSIAKATGKTSAQVRHDLQDIQKAAADAGVELGKTGESVKSAFDIKDAIGALGIGAGLTAVISKTREFEASLNTVKAVGNATAAQMAEVSKRAKELGNDLTLPATSASTAADAMAELTKGGLSVADSMTAAKGTLQLAAAAQIDGAEAATIQAKALNTFGLGADQAAHVSDLLANAANKSSGEIGDFAQALAQGGLVAKGAGISIDDTVTALAEFAQAGLVGSDAGTSLKTSLLALQTPTKVQSQALKDLGVQVYDAQGNFEGLEALSGQLAEAQKSMSQEAFNSAAGIAFGSDAVRAAQVFAKNGAEGWQEYSKALGETGSAAKLAGANAEGLPGALGNLQNAGENLALTLGEKLGPAITVAANAASGLIGLVTSIPGPVLAAVGAFGLLARFGPSIAGSFKKGEDGISSFRKKLTSVGKFAAGGLAFAGIGLAISFIADAFEKAKSKVTDFSSALDFNTGLLADNAEQAVATALAQAGTLKELSEQGVDSSLYVKAVLGDKGSQDQVLAILASRFKEADKVVEQAGSGASYNIQVRADTGGVKKAIDQAKTDFAGFAQTQQQATDAASATGRELDLSAASSKRYVDQLLAQHDAALKSKDASAAVTVSLDRQNQALQNVTALHVSQASAANVAAVASDSIADATDRAKAAYDKSKDALTKYGAATQYASDQQSALESAVSNVITQVDKLTGRVPSAEQAISDLNQATDDFAKSAINGEDGTNSFTGALVKANGEIDTSNQAGRDLRDNLIGIRDKTIQAAAATFENTKSTKGLKVAQAEANKVVVDARKAFIDAAVAAGKTTTEAEKMATAYGLIPSKVSTTIAADDKQAQDKAADIKRKLDILNSFKALSTLDAKDYATAKIAVVKQAIADFHDKTVTLTVEQVNLLQGVADSTRYTSPAGTQFNAAGGYISGPGTGTSDSILSYLSNGEFVVKADQTAKHLPLLHAINDGAPGFATGGLVSVNQKANVSASDATKTWREMYAAADRGAAASKVEIAAAAAAAAASAVIESGLLGSQDPSSFGWTRAQGIEPFSYLGHSILGGVAGGTQPLWSQLLGRVVPLIKGGLTGEQYGFEDRDNVNSPGSPSFHSYGLAVDLNAPYNGNGTNPGSGLYQLPPAVGAIAKSLGFLWGGDFTGTKDPMHLELHRRKGGGATGTSGGATAPASGVMDRASFHALAQAVAAAKGLHDPASAADIATTQAEHESSFRLNPPIPDDINAHNGSGGSQGILQFIRSTFERWKDPGFNNFLGAEDQLHAFYNYEPATYGSLDYLTRIGNGAYATGGPVSGHGSGSSDSILARVSNGEFIVNSAAASRNGALLRAINSGALPGFANGGPVLPNLRGATEVNRGPNEAGIFSGDQALIQYIRDLGSAAIASAEDFKQANAEYAAARTQRRQEDKDANAKFVVAKREVDERIAESDKKLADARKKTGAGAADAVKKAEQAHAKVLRDQGQRLDAATAAQKRALQASAQKEAAAKAEASSTHKAAVASKALYDAQRQQVQLLQRDRTKLATAGRQLDTITARRDATRGLLDQATADRASAIDNRASGFASIGGGALAFAGSRNSAGSFLKGLQDRRQKTDAYGKNLAVLRGFGVTKGSLFNELTSGSDDAIAQAALLARSGRGVVQQANRISLSTDASARRAATVVESGRNAYIGNLQAALKTQGVQIHDIAGVVDRLDRKITQGIRGVLTDLADDAQTGANRR